MKGNDLLIWGGLAVAGYLVYKYLSGSSASQGLDGSDYSFSLIPPITQNQQVTNALNTQPAMGATYNPSTRVLTGAVPITQLISVGKSVGSSTSTIGKAIVSQSTSLMGVGNPKTVTQANLLKLLQPLVKTRL